MTWFENWCPNFHWKIIIWIQSRSEYLRTSGIQCWLYVALLLLMTKVKDTFIFLYHQCPPSIQTTCSKFGELDILAKYDRSYKYKPFRVFKKFLLRDEHVCAPSQWLEKPRISFGLASAMCPSILSYNVSVKLKLSRK